ncbi:MAG: SEC-C metal-binding domain-containing protein [Clostridiales bacterium]|nr:SEC-C metal-binding domain-containing protein [Clostridiales bacterium]
MSLYQDWLAIAKDHPTQQDYDKFWRTYFDAETEVYKKILARHTEPFAGTLATLAAEFDMDNLSFTGFLDGINASLAGDPLELDNLTEESEITLAADFDKLYFNMLGAKADWLYELPEWDAVRTEQQRKEITKSFRASKVFVAEESVGRNDPCPCGSGKKYKKCCGNA